MINTPYGDSWFMASTRSYLARLIADAGGDYIYRRNTSNRSLPIDLEEAYLLTAEADVWLNVGNIPTLRELRTRYPKFADVRCVRQGAVYNCDRRITPAGGNDYWESGVVRPDLVLRDLIRIFHPELVSEDFYYYRQVE
jgi:ABC-type fe3+-hydroxamate transport system, periplasmic component